MSKHIRRIDKNSWLTDTSGSLQTRVARGVKEFRDSQGKPSVYIADTRQQLVKALAALAWDRVKRDIHRISDAKYVVITDPMLAEAGLMLAPEESTIPWRSLRGQHFVITVSGQPCSDADLDRLLEILIRSRAEWGTIPKAELRRAARFPHAVYRIRTFWGKASRAICSALSAWRGR